MSQVAGPSTGKQPGCPAREAKGKPRTTRAEVPANEADRPTQPDDPTNQTRVPTRIRIGQLNLQKARAATNNLLQILTAQQVSVCFIQEPHTRQGKIIGLGSPLKTFYRPGGNPRSAICTQGQEATVLLLEDISTETMTVAEVTVQGIRIYGISLYIPPVENQAVDFTETVKNIKTVITQLRQRGEILLCADANSKSSIWGSPTEDKRGEQFAEMLDEMDLTVMNAGNTPTFDGPRGTSFVDVTAASLGIFNNSEGWHITEIESMTDHRYIEITMNGAAGTETERKGFCNKKADWDIFKSTYAEICGALHENIVTCTNGEQLEAAAKATYDALRQSCAASMPARRKFRKSVSWWTPEFTQLRKEVRNLRRRYQSTTNRDREGNKTEYVRAFNAYKTRLLQRRMEKWREFCTENTETDPWGLAYRAINRRRPDQHITCVCNNDGTFTRTVNETAAALLEQFFPDDDRTDDTPEQHETRREADTAEGSADDRPFTEAEIRRATTAMKVRKAPGEDGITADVVQHAFATNPEHMTALLNKCLETRTFPRIWKVADVRLIPKPGKEDRTDPKSYRPICLLPMLGKVLNCLMISRIEHWISSQGGGYNASQYGFTGGRSVVDPVEEVVNQVKESREKNQYSTIVSLDVTGAFDNA